MKKLIIILLGLIVYCACQDEDDGPIRTDFDVSFSDFQDPRDLNTYKCITIGGQTWMAENLRYRSLRGSLDGCYTWRETDINEDDVKPEVEINPEVWVDSIQARIEKGDFDEDYIFWGMSMGMAKDYLLPIIMDNSKTPTEHFTTFKDGFAAMYPNSVLLLERIYNNLYDLAIEDAIKNFYGGIYNTLESKNGGYSAQYGLLYTYEGALQAVPEGWRLPTDEDWKKLEETLGMPVSELDLLDEWRGNEADLLKTGGQGIGFNANYAGGRLSGSYLYGDAYFNQGFNAYFWSSSKMVEHDTVDVGITRVLSLKENRILRGTSRLDGAYSVRCIKE